MRRRDFLGTFKALALLPLAAKVPGALVARPTLTRERFERFLVSAMAPDVGAHQDWWFVCPTATLETIKGWFSQEDQARSRAVDRGVVSWHYRPPWHPMLPDLRITEMRRGALVRPQRQGALVNLAYGERIHWL